MRKWIIVLCLLAGGLAAGCANASWFKKRNPPAEGMRINPENPTQDALISALNANARKVQSLDCRTVDLECSQGSETVGLRGLMVCQPKQRNFRLVAKVMGSTEVDVGSNSQEFWYWIKRAPQPYLFHCSHDDFARGMAQMPFPFQPDWITEALGVAEYIPTKKYEVRPNGGTIDLVEETILAQTHEFARKVTRLTATQKGYQVTAHLLLNNAGQEICSAKVLSSQQDAASGAVLPREVVLEWPEQKMKMKMNLDGVTVNRQVDNRLFARPQMTGVEPYDLARGPDRRAPHIRGTSYRGTSYR